VLKCSLMKNIRNFSIIAHTPVVEKSEFFTTGREVLFFEKIK
jgi:hypothetical protein